MTALQLLGPVALGSYLIGAMPFGYLIARSRGVNIFQQGSGNIGATNVGRILGRRFGIRAMGRRVVLNKCFRNLGLVDFCVYQQNLGSRKLRFHELEQPISLRILKRYLDQNLGSFEHVSNKINAL